MSNSPQDKNKKGKGSERPKSSNKAQSNPLGSAKKQKTKLSPLRVGGLFTPSTAAEANIVSNERLVQSSDSPAENSTHDVDASRNDADGQSDEGIERMRDL